MCVSDCAEGKELLKAAAQASAPPEARDAFVDHIRHCSACNPGRRGDTEVLRLDLHL
jgi:hypothetical protein